MNLLLGLLALASFYLATLVSPIFALLGVLIIMTLAFGKSGWERKPWHAGFAALFLLAMLAPAFAQTATAPVGDGLFGGLISLWGPLLGVLGALVLFFDRLAKVIPNSTTNGFLSILRKVSALLGLKVPDAQ